MKVHNFLVDWIETYFKNRDIIAKQIEKIERKEGKIDLFIYHKTGKIKIIIVKEILGSLKSTIDDFGNEEPNTEHVLVILNNKDNIKKIVENWDLLHPRKNLAVYFVNPISKTDTKWIIYPHTHHRITEKTVLESGLESIAVNVEEITLQELEKTI
ncbi:MAG: hypothetical protein QW331_04550 [Candidatus Woesearchaeota archaeon]